MRAQAAGVNVGVAFEEVTALRPIESDKLTPKMHERIEYAGQMITQQQEEVKREMEEG